MANPVPVTFGKYTIQTRDSNWSKEVFDVSRKRWVPLTPEEWVRQNWIHWLEEHGVPISRIKVEHMLIVLSQTRRADIVVFDRDFNPWMIIECKAPEIRLNQAVFDQAARYNLSLQVPFLVVTNGETTYACRIDYRANTYYFLDAIPTVV